MTVRTGVKNLLVLLSILSAGRIYSQTRTRQSPERLELSGDWELALETSGAHNDPASIHYTDHISLPGTLDENKKGSVNHDSTTTERLSSAYLFEGRAWYQREITIPASWKGKRMLLYMERTKPSRVWMDGIQSGSSDNLMTSQQFELPAILKPGKHKLSILVDNGNDAVPGEIHSSHAWTAHTQTNWNGITGKFFLQALNRIEIKDLQTYSDIATKKVSVHITLYNSTAKSVNTRVVLGASQIYSGAGGQPAGAGLHPAGAGIEPARPNLPQAGAVSNQARTGTKLTRVSLLAVNSFPAKLKPGLNQFIFDYSPGKNIQLWSEFNPAVYTLKAEVLQAGGSAEVRTRAANVKSGTAEVKTVSFGMRSFKVKGTQFTINGQTTFLRGNLDNCIFPLTGHPPMEIAGWRREFRIAKSYGFNHYRFHSWTPPEAAFQAADLEGIYLQVELPFWGSVDRKNTGLNTFLIKEGNHILQEFGNHPSFVMFTSGNELTGDTSLMKVWLNGFKSGDSRHLYAFGSNIFIGEKGYIPGEDYMVTMQIGTDTSFRKHVRGSFAFADIRNGGSINSLYPSLNRNYESALSLSPIPVIGHEVGQYQIYPDFGEISKYTGALKPVNLEIFQNRLNATGMGDLDKAFSKASGALAVICYKAEVEMALRTKGFGGFQLLDLQDYPGQGSALVGILDAFMDSKGLVTPSSFRQFNSSVVPLLVTEKYCWQSDERLMGFIKIANYSQAALKNQAIEWKLTDTRQQIISSGHSRLNISQGELVTATTLDIGLSKINVPQKLTMTIVLSGTSFKNIYSLWVYPAHRNIMIPQGVEVRSNLDAASLKSIEDGASVLLFPKKTDSTDRSVGGLFTTDFWNYAMFNGGKGRKKEKVSPGTMGILTNPEHPLFTSFPTEFHTDWQWWSIVDASNPLILDHTPINYRPIVQVIDNINRNHKLGLVFEFALGKGKLLVCMSDLRQIDRPEARQLYISILAYAASDKFHPAQMITATELTALLP